MNKPIGPQVIVRIEKKSSKIELLSTVNVNEEAKAVIYEVGTKCSLGIRKGHEVMFKHNTKPVIIESTEEHELLLIPEIAIAYVMNWTEEDEKGLQG